LKVVVTGASGKAGRAVVRNLLEREHDVLAVDVVSLAGSPTASLLADLTDFGQTVECLAGADAVVHLAAIPAPRIRTEETTFQTNTLSTYNVFESARARPASGRLGVERDDPGPAVRARAARLRADRRGASGLSGIELRALEAALGGARPAAASVDRHAVRRASLFEHHGAPRLRAVSVLDDPRVRRWNLWGYVDARDVAQSCGLALEADVGAEHFIVAAADTVMNRPSGELLAEVYPSVPYRPTAGNFDTLLSIQKARRLLGYEPRWSWRDHIAEK